MPALDDKIVRAQKQSAHLLKVARHRVARWFRPSVVVARQRASHPIPSPTGIRAEAKCRADQAV
jgi:hypothetical protein